MNKQKCDKDDFLMAFFDDSLITSPSDLAAKKDNMKYTDTYTIFKVEKDGNNAIRRSIQ